MKSEDKAGVLYALIAASAFVGAVVGIGSFIQAAHEEGTARVTACAEAGGTWEANVPSSIQTCTIDKE